MKVTEKAFAQFDPKKVAKFTPQKIEKLLENPQIVRNRLKVESTVSNAKAFLKIQEEFGSFDKYIWSFTKRRTIVNDFKNLKDYPSKTLLSDTISKDLKKEDFVLSDPLLYMLFFKPSELLTTTLKTVTYTERS